MYFSVAASFLFIYIFLKLHVRCKCAIYNLLLLLLFSLEIIISDSNTFHFFIWCKDILTSEFWGLYMILTCYDILSKSLKWC
jgi:hypothetical protein